MQFPVTHWTVCGQRIYKNCEYGANSSLSIWRCFKLIATILDVKEIMASKSIAAPVPRHSSTTINLNCFSPPFVSVVLALLLATAVNGLSIRLADPSHIDKVQAGNMNVTNSFFNSLPVPCPPESESPTLVPHVFSCEDYHICVRGEAFNQSCDVGLIFNIDRNQCSRTGRCLLDYEPICEQSFTLLPHVFDCRHYFYCDPSQVDPLLFACPGGQLFDQTNLRCVEEREANCGNPPEEELEPWPTSVWFVHNKITWNSFANGKSLWKREQIKSSNGTINLYSSSISSGSSPNDKP